MDNRRLIQAWFEVATLLKTAPAIDPGYMECMVQTSGKGDPGIMMGWYADLSALMTDADLKNLYRCHIHNQGMSVSEARSLGYRLRPFWKLVDKRRGYFESGAGRFYQRAG